VTSFSNVPNPEASSGRLWFRRVLLWAGAFLCPFFLAALLLLLPAVQRAGVNYLLNIAFPGASVAAVNLRLHRADLVGIRIPATGGRLEIKNLFLTSNWWRLLWTHQFNASQIYTEHIQFLPDASLANIGASQPFDLFVLGGLQDRPISSRPFTGIWHIQAAPQITLPGPAPSAPLDGGLLLSFRDPSVPGPQPFAEADFNGTLDPAFFWNLAPALTATHDQFTRALALFLRDPARLAAALRVIDAPGQLWKIHIAFASLPDGGCSWIAHLTLWGDGDFAADLAAVNLLVRGPGGAPVTDADGFQQGPTITVNGFNSQPTSTDFTDILMRMRQ
jgi:hypothetical protein